jgi:hypothetical protein
MFVPRTLEEVEKVVTSAVQESLHLDYKRSDALVLTSDKVKGELAKDVSAFANSDGGVLIYGVEEKDHLPVSIDGGVDHAKWTREKLENVIMTGVRPRLEGVEIIQIQRSSETSLFVIAVQRSMRGAHQETYGHRYYKRFNFQSVPMEDYEIRDLRARAASLPPLVSLDAEIRDSYFVDLVVTNNGDAVAEAVSFIFTPTVSQVTSKSSPNFFTKGIPYLPPRKEFRLFYGSSLDLVGGHPEGQPAIFDVVITYGDPRVGKVISDTAHIDITTFINTPIVHSPARQPSDAIKEAADKVIRELASVRVVLESFQPIAGATGLELSITSLRNLRRLFRGEEEFGKLDPTRCGAEAFRELLNVSMPVAHAISNYFRYRHYYKTSRLEDIHGVTADVIAGLNQYFEIDSENENESL